MRVNEVAVTSFHRKATFERDCFLNAIVFELIWTPRVKWKGKFGDETADHLACFCLADASPESGLRWCLVIKLRGWKKQFGDFVNAHYGV